MKYCDTDSVKYIGGRPPRGGRGLKSMGRFYAFDGGMSPPSRGAWIEMEMTENRPGQPSVAPLAGGVD